MNTSFLNGQALWAIIGGALGIVVGIFIGYVIHTSQPSASMQETNTNGHTTATTTATSTTKGGDGLIGTQTTTTGDGGVVTVNNQPAGYAVTVAHVAMPESGWIAVHEVLPGDIIGNVLGAARRDSGVYDSVIVDLLRATEPNKQYAVVLYKDNGNKAFDLSGDLPITSAGGTPIIERFNAQVPLSPAGN